MISFEMLYLLLSSPCVSAISHAPRETTVVMCEAPQPRGAALPSWWRPGMVYRAEAVKLPVKPFRSKAKRKGRRR